MKLLILGGTRFLGRALVEAALAAGHEITMFNRGQSGPDLFPDLERLQGDRDGELSLLAGRRWDAVIDTCGYVPRIVRCSAKLLAESVKHYTFISTISVYADPATIGIDEHSPLGTMADESVEEITGETYGPLKVLCEQAVDEAMATRALHVRAGLIVGPHDPTDRFTYWPDRIAKGGEVLAPGDPDQPIQFIDVRDIAKWTIWATEKRLTGPFNVTGPIHRLTMQEVLTSCQHVCRSDAAFTWVSEEFLLKNDVAPYTELPLWVPAGYAGFGTVNCAKVNETGLQIRPLDDTIRATLDWQTTRSPDHKWRGGMKPEREAELLQTWHNMKRDA